MDSTILSLAGAFLLAMIGLFVFIWSMRRGFLVDNPSAASIIFVEGEIGRVDDPALHSAAHASLQAASGAAPARRAGQRSRRQRPSRYSNSPARRTTGPRRGPVTPAMS